MCFSQMKLCFLGGPSLFFTIIIFEDNPNATTKCLSDFAFSHKDLIANSSEGSTWASLTLRWRKETKNKMWLMHDWAPPHLSLVACQFIDEYYPNHLDRKRAITSMTSQIARFESFGLFLWGHLCTKSQSRMKKSWTIE